MSPLDDAVAALDAGKLVVVPTDTVYGIAARPEISEAVHAIFQAKGRSDDKPLPVLGADREQLAGIAVFNETAVRLADAVWPGPLTLVLDRAAGFDYDLGGYATTTVGVRVPAQALTLSLLERTGPLAVTSANLTGEPPCTTIDEAWHKLGPAIDVYLDGGALKGRPSTVVALFEEMHVIREGALTEAELRRLLAG